MAHAARADSSVANSYSRGDESSSISRQRRESTNIVFLASAVETHQSSYRQFRKEKKKKKTYASRFRSLPLDHAGAGIQ